MELEITALHQEQYERDGYTLVRNGFTTDECDRFVAYMMDLHAGRLSVEGYPPRQPDDWSRLISRSLHHPAGPSLDARSPTAPAATHLPRRRARRRPKHVLLQGFRATPTPRRLFSPRLHVGLGRAPASQRPQRQHSHSGWLPQGRANRKAPFPPR